MLCYNPPYVCDYDIVHQDWLILTVVRNEPEVSQHGRNRRIYFLIDIVLSPNASHFSWCIGASASGIDP